MRRALRVHILEVLHGPGCSGIAAALLVAAALSAAALPVAALPAGGQQDGAPVESAATGVQDPGTRDATMSDPSIRGAWRPTRYVLAGGASHVVDGLIQFGEADWSVVFFVLDDEGRPRRASAEGGTYEIEGDRVVLTHRFNFSSGEEMDGLPSRPLRMSVAAEGEGETEPTRWEVEDGELVLSFPSGNRMFFERSPAGRAGSREESTAASPRRDPPAELPDTGDGDE